MARPGRLDERQLLPTWEVRAWVGPTGWVGDHLSSGKIAVKKKTYLKQLPSSAMGWLVR